VSALEFFLLAEVLGNMRILFFDVDNKSYQYLKISNRTEVSAQVTVDGGPAIAPYAV
jgi:hypothetical protein